MASKALVVGAGAVGLRTALELLRRNVKVILQSPRHPLDPRTCSMGAGGLWMPVHCPDPRTDRWALETLDELMPLAYDPDNDLVEIVPTVNLMRDHGGPSVKDFTSNEYQPTQGARTEADVLPEWSKDARLDFQHLTVEMLAWQNTVYQLRIPPEQEFKNAGYLYAWLFRPPIVNAPKMLEHMLAEVTMHADQVTVEGTEFGTLDEMRNAAKQLGCDALINCTGLGAAHLCPSEKQLVGGRGVTLQFDRKKAVRRDVIQNGLYDAVIATSDGPWASEEFPCYAIPRGDTIVVGGSYLERDGEEGIRQEESARLLKNAARMGLDVEKSPIVREWTGFRPYRPNVRCELDLECSSEDLKVVHNYGHGGSGWTINAGTAKTCVDALFGK